MSIVSNTSPIIFLTKINCIDLLRKLYSTVFIPPQVLGELGEIQLPGFIKIAPLSEEGVVYIRSRLGRIHIGELAAIALAIDMDATTVLLDDLLARKEAKRVGQNPTGVIGVLISSVEKGFMNSNQVIKLIEELETAHGMFLSQNLKNKINQRLDDIG